ncbi:MAG: ferric reductase-like transmembrane domain-containing protein [Acidimicrobiia bacterium]
MNHLFWYTARAGGIVAWALLAASVIWGLWLSGRVRPFGVRPAWILDLHRFLGGLATIFVGVHVGSILLDSYTSFGLSDVLVPFASSWHPLAVAWGVVAMYVLLAVELTSLARSRLPHRVWRRIHMAALPIFILSTVHYVAAGTDASNRISLAAIGVSCGTIALLFSRRMHEVRERGGVMPGPEPDRVPATVGAAGTSAEDRVAAHAARRQVAARRR